MDFKERVDNYYNQTSWPPPQVHTGRDGQQCMHGWWTFTNYQGHNDRYGCFPKSFLKRVNALFPETPVLHLFSGGLEPAEDRVTVDADPHTPADHHKEVSAFLEDHDRQYPLVIADPPYSEEHHENYKEVGCPVEYPNMHDKKEIISSAARNVEVGGHLLWLDVSMPIWKKADNWLWGGGIAIYLSTMRRMRALFILKKVRS